MQTTTLTQVEGHFSEVCHQLIEKQDVLLVTQGNADNVVIMPQALFDSWQKMVDLFKSSANAALLEKIEDFELNVLADKRLNDGQALIKVSLDELNAKLPLY
jgi:PHD/YefM family antitoxin component YafN of YafNO toxin-antitoxin module